MFGLDLALAGALHLAAFGDVTCTLPRPPRISVKPNVRDVRYDLSKSRDQLSQLDIDTVSPYGKGDHIHVNGAMRGEFQIETSYKYITETFRFKNKACVYIDNITVKVNFDPTIYIARHMPKGSCEYNAVLEHEYKHLKVDHAMVNKYVSRIEAALRKDIRNKGAKFGPIDPAELGAFGEGMKSYYSGLVQKQQDVISKERLKLQQSIDSLEEYERVSAQCKARKKRRR